MFQGWMPRKRALEALCQAASRRCVRLEAAKSKRKPARSSENQSKTHSGSSLARRITPAGRPLATHLGGAWQAGGHQMPDKVRHPADTGPPAVPAWVLLRSILPSLRIGDVVQVDDGAYEDHGECDPDQPLSSVRGFVVDPVRRTLIHHSDGNEANCTKAAKHPFRAPASPCPLPDQ